jgi:dihydroorotase-like cyclic amidohydrolase
VSAEILTIPAAVDVHVHLREPGNNKAETIESGTRALMLGGIVAANDMSNNRPRPTWYPKDAREKHRIIRRDAFIPVGTAAGSQPEEDNLAELPALAKLSDIFKSFLGRTTNMPHAYEAGDFKEGWRVWHEANPLKPIFVHRGEADLEQIIGYVAQDLGHPLHICHVNSPEEVKLVQKARKRGLLVTSGVTPHHIFMTSNDSFTRGAFGQMMPELAHQIDTEKLRHMLIKGDIDIVESDHAPHSYKDKMRAEVHDGECFGVPGGEFMMPLLLRLVKKRQMTPERLVQVTSTVPAAILGVRLSPKTKASWLMEDYRFSRETHGAVASDAGWNPYLGMMATGRLVNLTIGNTQLVRPGHGITGERVSKVIKRRGQVI